MAFQGSSPGDGNHTLKLPGRSGSKKPRQSVHNFNPIWQSSKEKIIQALRSLLQAEQPSAGRGLQPAVGHSWDPPEPPLHPADTLCAQIGSRDSPCSLLCDPRFMLGWYNPLPSPAPHHPFHRSSRLKYS